MQVNTPYIDPMLGFAKDAQKKSKPILRNGVLMLIYHTLNKSMYDELVFSTHLKNMFVKLDHFPGRDEHKNDLKPPSSHVRLMKKLPGIPSFTGHYITNPNNALLMGNPSNLPYLCPTNR